jgi:hypothetical protein
MTDPGTQHSGNHAQYVPAFHFFALPVSLVYAINALVLAVKNPEWSPILHATFAFAVATAFFTMRGMALTVQDRLIRLEETLRMQRVLPAGQQGDIARISRAQFVALRFASDEELPELVQKTVSGQLATPKAIKQAIKNWRADHLRA